MATALRDRGLEVVAHDDRFAQDTPDAVWLQEVGQLGWLVVTKDKRIRTRHLESEALRAAGVGAFFLSSGRLTSAEMVARIIRHLPAIRRVAHTTPRPFLALIGARDVKLLR